uniref:Autoimmune regulator n=1 Tax=Sus scrofa TaxID=9823 RepID=A0A480GTH8_PIG
MAFSPQTGLLTSERGQPLELAVPGPNRASCQGRVHDPSVPFRARWVAHQEGKVGASASGRDMLWMAHCRMPSKGCSLRRDSRSSLCRTGS